MLPRSISEISQEIADLVKQKNIAYGDSVGKTEAILSALYPAGVRPDQYGALLLVVRVLDKIARLANQGPDGLDKGGESPWRDICGYALLGISKDR